jgi:hypothetical protein
MGEEGGSRKRKGRGGEEGEPAAGPLRPGSVGRPASAGSRGASFGRMVDDDSKPWTVRRAWLLFCRMRSYLKGLQQVFWGETPGLGRSDAPDKDDCALSV